MLNFDGRMGGDQLRALAGSPEQFPQFFLCLLEDLELLLGKVLSGPIDVEVEHGHGRLKRCPFTPGTFLGGALERSGDFNGIFQGEYPSLQIQGIALTGDLPRPEARILFHVLVFHKTVIHQLRTNKRAKPTYYTLQGFGFS